ncbi:MAG TPA: hypothetical protein VGI21_04705 [Streptosporangiaceae bacterium]
MFASKYTRALSALLAAGATAGLVSTAASAATTPSPAAGIAPGAAVVGSTRVVGYTATDGSVQLKNLSTGAVTPAGGHLVSAPQLFAVGSTLLIFGQAGNDQLMETSCTLIGGCGAWTSLGGRITAKPSAAVSGPAAEQYSVYARGQDSAVWTRQHTQSGWGAWHSLGGQLLHGTGPAAAYVTSDGPYVMVVGENQELYLQGPGQTGFTAVGGRTSSTPALNADPDAQNVPAALVGFARGTDNAAWYHRFNASAPGWHSLGGRLTTGPAALLRVQATIPENDVYALGTDNQIYENIVDWGAATPGVSGWHLAG